MKDLPSNMSGKAVSEETFTDTRESPDVDFLGEDDDLEQLQIKNVAAVWWEDITAYSRVEIPDDFEIFRLSKITVGLVWKETEDYVVLVQDYDLTNRGRGYRHNDFHIIPRGTIKRLEVLGEVHF
ncbi:hypothetical protein [Candidatus Aquicultor secundus]|nr:hypothetical protein [Candidatus Aquicultor secundus]NCO65991.1 hypothetical protein [Solirubrobacter sp.]